MIEPQYFWRNVFILAIGTLVIRGSIMAISTHIKISDRWKEIFSYIPAAILPAFIIPTAFFHQGHVPWLYGKERFFVLILATIIYVFSRSTLATIGFGLLFLYLLHTF